MTKYKHIEKNIKKLVSQLCCSYCHILLTFLHSHYVNVAVLCTEMLLLYRKIAFLYVVFCTWSCIYGWLFSDVMVY